LTRETHPLKRTHTFPKLVKTAAVKTERMPSIKKT
jgi:hypothetical protein